MSDLRVLVVDDDPLLLPALGRTLRSWGYDAVCAHTAEEALTELHHRPADVVIADFILPGMDGVALLQWVAERFPESTRILMSGARDQALAKASANTSIAGFVGKPIDPVALASIIALSTNELPSEAQSSPPEAVAPPSESLARVAAGVVGEVKPRVEEALRALEGLAESMATDDARQRHVADAGRALQEARATLGQLQRFGDRRPVKGEPVDLNELFGRLPTLLGRKLGASIILVVTPAAQPVIVRGDRAVFERWLVELAARARARLPKGGQLRFTLHAEGKRAVLRVEDDGPPLAASALDHLFEPYPAGGGDPLRLAGIYGAVARIGGQIAGADEGRVILFELPLV